MQRKKTWQMRNKIFSVTKNTNFHDNTFTLLQRIYCQNISVSLHNLRKSPIFAKFNNANVHCHKENIAFENELNYVTTNMTQMFNWEGSLDRSHYMNI